MKGIGLGVSRLDFFELVREFCIFFCGASAFQGFEGFKVGASGCIRGMLQGSIGDYLNPKSM